MAKLNSALRLLRNEIVEGFGEDALIEIAGKKDVDGVKEEGDGSADATKEEDTNESHKDEKEDRLHQLSTAFHLRMKLRRRLLNRLARRLYRVAYIMDNGDASPPLPPMYGDEVVRFKDDDEYCRFISEEEVMKFVEGETKKRELRDEIGAKRRQRLAELEKKLVKDEEGASASNEHIAVEFLLRGDSEDKPLLNQLKEYEVGYDRATVESEGDKPAETNPIVNTTDSHEVTEDGEFINKDSDVQRVNFSLIGLDKRPIPPRDRSADWKRWNKEMSTKIGEQVTFEDIGMEGKVFDLEKRLEDAKRKREEGDGETSPRGKGKVLRRKSAFDSSVGDDDKEENRGKGKELKREVKKEESDEPEKEGNEAMEIDGDAKMEADEVKSKTTDSLSEDKTSEEDKEAKTDKEAKAEIEIKAPKRHNRTFSLRPVPSFYTQDLRRVQLVQLELVLSSGKLNLAKYAKKAQMDYEVAFKKSMELQQAKAAAIGDYQKAVQQHKAHVQSLKTQAEKKLNKAKTDWQQMQNTMQTYRSTYGDQHLQLKMTCSDAMQDTIDRVVLRTSTNETPQGTKLTRHVAREAHSSKNDFKLAVANTLGWIVDSVDRRNGQSAQRHPTFIPPIVETEHNTIHDPRSKETIAERIASVEAHLKKRVQHASLAFDAAEKSRAAAWNEVTKYRTLMANMGAGSKPKSSRKSYETNRSVAPAAAPRQAYQQQPAYRQQQQQFMPVGRPIQMMQSAPMPVQRRQQAIPAQMMAAQQQGQSFNRVAASMPVQQQNQPDGQGKMSQNVKYGYGDR